MNCVAINNLQLPIKEVNNQRVVTFKDIDQAHGRLIGTAQRNFNSNRKHFIENEDYFIIKPINIQNNEIRCLGIVNVPNRGITLFTETGYLMVVKSFTDDLAWQVQRQLVNTYFKMKEIVENSTPQPVLNNDIQLQVSDIAERVARQTTEQILNATVNVPPVQTVQYVEVMQQPVIDTVRDTIKPLAELYSDGSTGYNVTFRKVYEAMGCNWKYRRSRYKNKRGNKKAPSNIILIEQDSKLMKLYIDTVNRLINESQTVN